MLLKKLKSKQGISLPVAMAITAVLIILSASLIAIAATSIMNTSSSVSNRQAYLNVRSALEYAYAYYSDSSSVPDLTKVDNEYMVMNDKEGGTTNQGAQIVDEAAVANYTTYVVATYLPPSSGRDAAALKLKAFSRSTDAFGKRSQSVTMSGVFTVNKLANKNRVTLTDIDMDTEVLKYNNIRDAITLHVKQYPGENWTPFYYLWTYADQAEMYAQTGNCYGLETVYKNKLFGTNSSGIYYDTQGHSQDVVEGFNKNEHDDNNLLEPASVWNSYEDSNDPRNGTTSYFSPTSNGWYDATYYIVNNVVDKNGVSRKYSDDSPMKQVNYFNFIITAKGKVLNKTSTNQMDLDTQTNEMFHLWYLNNADRNIYFEFLKPGMQYTPGSGWNGIQELDDRILAYVKNQKTAIHFKVKTIGDEKYGAIYNKLNCEVVRDDDGKITEVKGTDVFNPIVNDIRVGGVPIFQTDHTYDSFSSAMSSSFYGVGTLEKAWTDAHLGAGGKGDMNQYFYGISNSGQSKMMYEGCGWWITNVETSGTFSLTVTYGDEKNAQHTGSVNVTPNSDNEAFVVVDLDRHAILSRLTESRANEILEVDDESYSTIHVKSSDIGSAIAPYIDYRENQVSSAERRRLLEAVEKGQQYVMDDYEENYYNILSAFMDEGLVLYNDVGYIDRVGLSKANEDYKALTDKILGAIADLEKHPKACSPKAYQEFEAAVAEGDKIVSEQQKSKKYDGVAYADFVGDTAIYTRCKALRDNGDILNKKGTEAYTTTAVNRLTTQLKSALNTMREKALNKEDLDKHIKEGETYVNNSRYVESYRTRLNRIIVRAKGIYKDSTSQTEINDIDERLVAAIGDVKSHMAVTLDTQALTQLIALADEKLNATKENCTDETYNALRAANNAARAVFDNSLAKQTDVDGAYDALNKAYKAFEVIKPSENISINAISTDKLLSQNKMRVWVKGLNSGSKIAGYFDNNNAFVYHEYTVISFTLEEYIGNTPRGTNLNSDGAYAIEKQNLTYFDIDMIQSNGYLATVVLEHKEYDYNNPDPSTGSYPVLSSTTESYSANRMISSSDVSDGNFVIEFESLKKETSVSAGGKTQEINTLNVRQGKLAEYYVKNGNDTSVEVYNDDNTTAVYTSVKEGPYDVVRFSVEANQKAVVKTNINSNEFIYSYVFDVVAGQYVVSFNGSDRQNASILRVLVPGDIEGVPASSVREVHVIINDDEQNYPLDFDGSDYLFEMNYSSPVTLKFKRYYYGGDGTSIRETTSTGIQFNSAGEFYVQYSNISDISPINGVGTFVNETASLLTVSKIYPKYGTGSSSSTDIMLDGLVSDSILSGILKLPKVVEAAQTPFDYFGQSGVDSMPTKHLGTTIIWINTANNRYFENKDLSKLRVYAWDYNKISLTGEWPGRQPIRVAESEFYYLPVNSSAQGCVLSFEYGKDNIQKIGSRDLLNNYKGNIYFDMTDYCIVGKGSDYKIVKEPGICAIGGQGTCSLYEIIDQDVLDSTYYGTYGGFEKNGITHYDGYCYRAPGRVEMNSYWTQLDDTYPKENQYGDFIMEKISEYNPDTRQWEEVERKEQFNVEVYYQGKYYYRAKTSNSPPVYEYEEPFVDTSDMTATNLRMAFVGGTKIRFKNESYYYSYGSLYTTHSSSISSQRKNSSHSVNIAYNNLFGGSGGNGGSMGRIGDTNLTMVYDWFEYKIPVDQTNTYTFQTKGLKYNPSYVGGAQWYDSTYKTDIQYTDQVKGVYGNVWMIMKDSTTVKDGKFTNLVLYTSSPEDIQIKDKQDVYFRLPSGWPSGEVKVKASGVGEDKEYSFVNYNGLLKTSEGIPSSTPFLVFTAKDSSGGTFTCRTSLQGNDLILFDPTFRAGTGGWDNYIDPVDQVERELYVAHSIYYGSVLPKEYDSNGNAVNMSRKYGGDQPSYDYAEGLKKGIIKGNFNDNDMYVNDNGRAQSFATVHSYVAAYQGLYAMMAKARSYISGHNYPEYLHNGKPNIYDAGTISELEAELGRAKNTYISENSSLADVNTATANLQNKINNVTVSTSGLIPLIFYDTQNLVGSGATFSVEYSTDPSGNNPVRKQTEHFNTEKCPIIFIAANDIYNVKFIINGTEECVEKDHISVIDGAWVYMDIAKKAGVTTSYWVQNTASDYRQIANTEFVQANASESCNFDMTVERKAANEVIEKAGTLDVAKARSYRPVTFYFKHDVTVKLSGGASYMIRAGAYSFNDKQIGEDGCPVEYVNDTSGGSDNWIPRMNLYSERAKNYFTDPDSYWKYSATDDNAVEATTLNGWVTEDGNKLSITAGGHNTTNTVNMTVNSGSFAATRVWNYLTTGKMYFRWEGNSTLRVDNNVSITANEIVFASSGTVDATNNYNKHVYFQTKDRSQDTMEVIFPTDLHIEYLDKYREEHSFTIREGSYTVKKADPNQSFICDLCDEDYWESMVYVKINNRLDSLGGYSGSSNKNPRFGSAVFSND